MPAKAVPAIESCTIEVEGEALAYEVHRSKQRRKTLSISIDPARGVRVLVPAQTSKATIDALVRERAPWILLKVAEHERIPAPRQFLSGEMLPFRGKDLPLTVRGWAEEFIRIELTPGGFRISVPANLPESEREGTLRFALVRWYHAQAESVFGDAVRKSAAAMRLTPRAVLVRDQRNRWGSCSFDGVIRLNWRLILADDATLEYVVVHELAHLVHRNHSREFWALVERYLPDHRERRTRLREASPRLTI